MPKFTLRSLLVLTALIAVALLSLVKPSVAWLLLLPPLATIFCVYAFVRAVAKPPDQVWWISFLVGVAAFLFMVAYIELEGAILGNGPPPAMGTAQLGGLIWQVFHPNSPLPNNSGTNEPEFASFCISLHMILAVACSAASTFVISRLRRS